MPLELFAKTRKAKPSWVTYANGPPRFPNFVWMREDFWPNCLAVTPTRKSNGGCRIFHSTYCLRLNDCPNTSPGGSTEKRMTSGLRCRTTDREGPETDSGETRGHVGVAIVGLLERLVDTQQHQRKSPHCRLQAPICRAGSSLSRPRVRKRRRLRGRWTSNRS